MKKILSIFVLVFFIALCSCQTTYECGMASHYVYDETGHWHPCAVPSCNVQYLYEEHNFSEWVDLKPATEEEIGIKEHTCLTCGYTETVTYEFVPHVHTDEWQKNETEHWCICAECGEEYAAGEHDYEWTTKTPAKCTVAEVLVGTCACGDQITREGEAAKGHRNVIDEAVEPTCSTTGLTEGYHCSVCGHVEVMPEVVPTLPHNYAVEFTPDSHDEEGHWYPCVDCGAGEKVAHNLVGEYQESKYVISCECGYTVDENHVFTVNDFAGLKAAIAHGGNIKLTANILVEEVLTIAEGTMVNLDLNGKTINVVYVAGSDTNHIYAIHNYGDLTIDGNGTINARGIFNYGNMTLVSGTINASDGNGGYAVRSYEGAKFVMNGGKIATTLEDDHKVNNGGYDATTVRVDAGATFVMNDGEIVNICDYTFAIDNSGDVVINGGSVTSVHSTISSYGTLVINGGTFVDNGLEGVTAHVIVAWEGSVTIINGGTFDGKDNYNGFNVDACAGSVVDIMDGTFLSVHSGSLYGEGMITVYGGKFFDNPSKNILSGLEVIKQNGFYVVVESHTHDEVIDEAVAATCTEAGLTAGSHCSLCEEVLVAQEVVPALGHSVVTDKAVAATCVATGLTEGSHCSLCGEVFVAQEVIEINPKNHSQHDYDALQCSDCNQTATVDRYYAGGWGNVNDWTYAVKNLAGDFTVTVTYSYETNNVDGGWWEGVLPVVQHEIGDNVGGEGSCWVTRLDWWGWCDQWQSNEKLTYEWEYEDCKDGGKENVNRDGWWTQANGENCTWDQVNTTLLGATVKWTCTRTGTTVRNEFEITTSTGEVFTYWTVANDIATNKNLSLALASEFTKYTVHTVTISQ